MTSVRKETTPQIPAAVAAAGILQLIFIAAPTPDKNSRQPLPFLTFEPTIDQLSVRMRNGVTVSG